MVAAMKNPFPVLIAVHDPDVVEPECRKGWRLRTEDGEKFENPTGEQIQYAAEAINQHEGLVRQRDKAWEALEALDCAPGKLSHPELDGYCAYCKANLEIRDRALA